MAFVKTDGGRAAAWVKKGAGKDCVARAIAIATQQPYDKVFAALAEGMAAERLKKKRGSPSNGVYRTTYDRYLKALGWEFVATMGIGTGCKVHLRADELPKGRIIARVSKHLVAVVDGVIHDDHDPARGGTRCVYGYYRKAPTVSPTVALNVREALADRRKAQTVDINDLKVYNYSGGSNSQYIAFVDAMGSKYHVADRVDKRFQKLFVTAPKVLAALKDLAAEGATITPSKIEAARAAIAEVEGR